MNAIDTWLLTQFCSQSHANLIKFGETLNFDSTHDNYILGLIESVQSWETYSYSMNHQLETMSLSLNSLADGQC